MKTNNTATHKNNNTDFLCCVLTTENGPKYHG